MSENAWTSPKPPFEGAGWWKVDLHTHTPASYDYKGPKGEDQWRVWVEAARDAGLDAVAVTDHDGAEGIEAVRSAAREIEGAPVIFPGVELSVGAIHLLAIFDPSAEVRDVEALLHFAGIPPTDFGKSSAVSKKSLVEILEYRSGATRPVFIAAHANATRGLLHEQSGKELLQALRAGYLDGLEIVPVSEARPPEFEVEAMEGALEELLERAQFSGARVLCSDAHKPIQLGRDNRFTWMKMGLPSLDGLRLALDDIAGSVQLPRPDNEGEPNRPPRCWIRKLTVHDAKYMGRGQPLELPLSPWLTTLVGGRGTGKSTLVDFLRLALRRGGELSELGRLPDDFQDRVSISQGRGGPGLLTPTTKIEAEYEKDGERFRLNYAANGEGPTVERWTGDAWTEEASTSISERFPIRIYGQKQLFEMSSKPSFLLDSVDAAHEVDGVGFQTELERLATEFLRLRAAMRKARSEADRLPKLEADHADLVRRIESLESGGHAEALNRHRLIATLDERWAEARSQLLDDLDQVRAATDAAAPIDLTVNESLQGDPGVRAVCDAHAQLAAEHEVLVKGVAELVERAEKRVREAATLPAWRATLDTAEQAAREARVQMAEAGLTDVEQLPALLSQATALTRDIEATRAQAAEAERLEADATKTLEAYRSCAERRTRARAAFASSLAAHVEEVRLDITSGSEDEAAELLAEQLGLDRFEREREKLAEHLQTWSFAALDHLVDALRDASRDPSVTLDGADNQRFKTRLAQLPPERLDRLQLHLPKDRVELSYPDLRSGKLKKIDRASPGQRTAALLAFVLGHGKAPLVLDQPEDDLDTALIYDLVVRRLREVKPERQVIIVTHNPNIVVHGDAELVVSLDVAPTSQTMIAAKGSLQQSHVREEICRVMEGGKEALEKRYRRIMAARP